MRDIEKEAELCGTKKKGAFGEEGEGALAGAEGSDPMLRAAIELAVEAGKISTSLIQRRLSLGYGRAAKLIDQMQDMGIVGPQEGQKPRNVLITASEWAEMVMREKDM
jgi:S-DNA-T family DNA segregation ATPase FtsK/SpoIIIE